jgi:hypothetical protein
MPFFYWHSFEMNGFNFILSDHIPPYKYFLLPIPVLGLIHLLCVLSHEKFYYSSKLLSWVPLVSLAVIFIMVFVNERSDDFFRTGNIFSNTGAGFWLALLFSMLLTFVSLKEKSPSH